MPTKVRFQAYQVSLAAQGSFPQKVLLRLGKPESVLWHHRCISMVDSRLLVYATPVVEGGRLRGYAWCGMQLSTPQFRGVLHKPRTGIVPDPLLVKAVWLRETSASRPDFELRVRGTPIQNTGKSQGGSRTSTGTTFVYGINRNIRTRPFCTLVSSQRSICSSRLWL